jgi:hypothetical protein
MNKYMSHKVVIPLLLAVLSGIGCVDLKGINSFSATSTRVFATPWSYSYSDYCYDSCYNYDTTEVQYRYPCDCAVAIAYDTLVAREGVRLAAYFTALAKLSGSEEIIDVDTLGGSIAAGQYGKVNVTATDVQIIGVVATAIQDLVTSGYKSRHVADNLRRFSDTIGLAIDRYTLHLSALSNQYGNLSTYLGTQLLNYRLTAPPGNQRWAIDYAYSEKIRDLEKRYAQFLKLMKLLQKVKAGYALVAANADNVKSKALKKQLLALVNNITFLSSKN